MRQIGTALQGAQPRRTRDRQPVRGGSHRHGRCEATFWRRTSRQETRQIVRVAQRFELVGRQPGRRRGPLGHVALEVLQFLANLVDYRTGRLEPSHEYIAAKVRRSRSAVAHALKALREHGFLERLRRYEETDQEGERGPQVRQVSNAYRLSLPTRAARLLGRLLQPAPLPDDVAQEHEERAAEREAYKAALPLDELPMFQVEDDRLRQLLADLGRSIQERESTKGTETRTKGF